MIFLTIFIITVFTAIGISIANFKKNQDALFLSAFILILSLYEITHYFILINPSVYWGAALYINFTPLYLLLGPLLYFYLKRSLFFDKSFKNYEWFHFAPAIIDLIGISAYLLTSFDYKQEVISNLFKDYNTFASMDFHLIYKPFVSFTLRIGLLLAYTFNNLFLLKSFYYKKKDSDGFNSKKKRGFQWLWLFHIFVLIVVISYTLFTYNIFTNNIFARINEVFIPISGIGIVLMSLSLLIYPSLTKNISKLAYKEVNQEKLITENPYFHQLKERIDTYFIKYKPYLKKKFTRSDLARVLNVPEHHITHCFTFIYKSSFPVYKNQFRVQLLKELLDNADADIKIDKLYSKVGFTSKSSMYTTFKEFVGMTPNQYLKEMLKSKNVK